MEKPMFSDAPVAPKRAEVHEDDMIHEDVVQKAGNVLDLPSNGKMGYPSQITFREVLARDEEILKMCTANNYARTVNSVLKSICNDADFFDDISTHDRDFILTTIWSNTYSPDKTFELKCRECGHKDSKTINMFELEVDHLADNFKPYLKFHVKTLDEDVRVRMMTVRDENIAERYLAKFKEDQEKPNFETVLMAICVEYDRVYSTEDKIERFRRFTVRDSALVKKYHKTFSYGLDTQFTHSCSECGEVTTGNIPFLPQDIIAPEVRDDFAELLSAD